MAEFGTKHVIEFVSKLTGIRQAEQAMTRLEAKARSVGGTFTQGSRFVDAQTRSFTRNGKRVLQYSATFENSQKRMTVAWEKTGKGISNVNKRITSYNKAGKGAIPVTQQLTKALARVAIVAPVWFLFRRVMLGVFQTLRDGYKDMVDFDKILQKARRNLQGSTSEITANFEILRKKVRELSVDTGESVQDVTYAFQRFATTGLDFETSMAGAEASARTAIIMFGETKQVANAVARAFRVLGGRTDEFATKGEELTSFLALTAKLWKTNAFDINEFAGALERIAPTARASNLSLHETAILLSAIHTAGIRGTRAGRLLSTMILQMEKNFDKVNATLGTNIKESDSTFNRILAIANALEKLNKSNPIEASQTISSLFRIRGGQVVRSITAMLTELEKMKDIRGDIDEFNKSFEDVDSQIHRVQKRFNNLNKEIGRAIVRGIVGADDFAEALNEVTKIQEKSVGGFETFFRGVSAGMNLLFLRFPTAGKDFANIFSEPFTRGAKELNAFLNQIDKGLSGKLGKDELTALIDEYQKAVGRIPRELSKLDKILGKETFKFDVDEKTATEQIGALRAKLREQFAKKPLDLEADINIEPTGISFGDQQKIAKILVAHETDLLKLQGAKKSNLLREEALRSKQLGIVEDEFDVLRRQLEIQRAITEEQRLRNELSSDSVKLFRIAQEQGTAVARKLGEVLSGDADFANFVRRGGKELEIFKKEFANIFEQQQALAFFKGDTVPGIKGLRGGSSIPIEEEALRERIPFYRAGTELEKARAERILPKIKTEINARIDVNITGQDAGDLTDSIIDTVHTELQKDRGQIKTDVQNIVNNF